MTEEQFRECYMFCIKQGWVHNTPIQDLVNDYFTSPEGRNVLFQNHLKKIIEGPSQEIHILIGEAPPYYPNCEFPKHQNRKYFYDENQSMNTAYFKEPCKHFLGITDWKKNEFEKSELLDMLAKKGVLIFDIFPFPVYQSTDLRERVVWGKSDEDEEMVSSFYSFRQSFFNEYLNIFFSSRFTELMKAFSHKEVRIYMFAPKLASVQFLLWFQSQTWFKNLISFNAIFEYSEFTINEKTKKAKTFLSKSMLDFLTRLNVDSNGDIFISDVLKQHPIFMNGSGNPDFQNFVNGKKISK